MILGLVRRCFLTVQGQACPGEGAVARTLGKEGTSVRMVNDLHRLVTFSYPQERPFLLVGSELGGLVARMYAHLHPQDVSHVVMIDPISESLFDDVSNKNDVEKTENPWISYWFGHLLLSFRLLHGSEQSENTEGGGCAGEE